MPMYPNTRTSLRVLLFGYSVFLVAVGYAIVQVVR